MRVFRFLVVTTLLVGCILGINPRAAAQFPPYNSGGFEGFTLNPLSPQDNWETTDINQLIFNTPAGIVQSATTFQGNRAFQIVGSNLFFDNTFGGATIWYQAIAPFNPVLNGTPIVRTAWRQMVTGVTGDLSQIAYAGVTFEGLNAGGTQQVITQVYYDAVDRITVMSLGGNFFSSAPILNSRNNWLDFQVDLNFNTQRFTVFVDNNLIFNNIPFRNSNGATNRLVEFGFLSSPLNEIITPTNNAFMDNYLVTAFAVPEPSTYVLGGLTIVALGGYWQHRRRRQQKALQDEVVEPAEAE